MKNIIKKCIISPHIDDAFLSLGGSILNWVNQKEKVKIINVFSISNWTNSNAISGKKYTKDTKNITYLRKMEEKKILEIVKTHIKFLPYLDRPLRLTFTSEEKKYMIKKVEKDIIKEIDKDTICFFPMTHIHLDHKAIREIGLQLPKKGYRVQFYEDLPYAANTSNFGMIANFIKYVGLVPITEKIDLAKKMKILRCYRSQVSENMINQIRSYSLSLKDNKYYERYWKLKDKNVKIN